MQLSCLNTQISCSRTRTAKTTQTPPGPIYISKFFANRKMHFPPSTMHWLQAQLECGPGKGGSSGTRQRGAKEAALNCAARGLNARADAHFCDSSSQGVVGDQRGMPGRARQCRVGRWELCIQGLRSRLMTPRESPPPRPCAAFEEVGIDELQVNRVLYRLNDTREAHREGRGARTMLQV